MRFTDVNKPGEESFLATFLYGRLSYLILKVGRGWPVTANQITILSFIFASISAISIFLQHLGAGIVFMNLFYILDCLDGQFARINHDVSSLGEFLDHYYGTVFIYFIYFAIAWNCERNLSFLLLLIIVLYNYGVLSTPHHEVAETIRSDSPYFGFGFDVQLLIMTIGYLIGQFYISLWLIVLVGVSFWWGRLVLITLSEIRK